MNDLVDLDAETHNNMRMMQMRNRSLGFTLIEMMVAIAIMGIVALSSTTLLVQQMKLNRTSEMNVAIEDAMKLLKMALANPDVCKAPTNLGGLNLSVRSVTINGVTSNKRQTNVATVGNTAGNDKLFKLSTSNAAGAEVLRVGNSVAPYQGLTVASMRLESIGPDQSIDLDTVAPGLQPGFRFTSLLRVGFNKENVI